jgi:cephalosporin hydroxylase
VREEITDLLEEVKKEEPRVMIEIGTAMGGTLFLFCRAAAEIATIISIDLPGGEFGGGYSSLRIPLYKAFKLPKQRIHLIRADSHKEATLQQVKRVLNGEKADLLFIDGDHSYNGIKMDFEMFSPLVKDGGLIALHDIVVHPVETGCEVNKFWEEIKNRYEYTEFVSDWNQGWAGIGTIRWRI